MFVNGSNATGDKVCHVEGEFPRVHAQFSREAGQLLTSGVGYFLYDLLLG